MAILTLAELFTSESEDDVLEFFLTELGALGWPVTDWALLSPQMALLRVIARGKVKLSELIALVAKGGFLDTATGVWLTLLARGIYLITRQPAVFAVIKVRLTRTSGSSAMFTTGQLWVRTVDGRQYNQTAGGTLGGVVGNTLDLEFRASSGGIASNLTIGTPLTFVTPPVGVAVALTETTAGSGSCMVVPGVNEEGDPSLAQRCRTKWASLGVEKTRDAYVFLARNAKESDGITEVLGITKVLVDDSNPRGAGTVDVYLGGDAGAITDPVLIGKVDDYLQPRKGLCADLEVNGATNDTVSVVATVRVKAAYLGTAKEAIRSALQEYQATLQISDGTSPMYEDDVIRAELIRIMKSPAGVTNVTVSSPASDYQPAKGHTPLLSYVLDGGGATITMVSV